MPGRRRPRGVPETAQGQHLLNAFRGGLDGSSAVPNPIGMSGGSGARGALDTPPIYFTQDRFEVSGGVQMLPLTFLPIVHSEHVYLLQAGSNAGAYQRQNKAWERDSGSNELRVLNAMNTSPGDVVIVEYAYYSQPAFTAPVDVPPKGTRYGPWITDAQHFGQLLQPKVLMDEVAGTYKYLGDGMTSYSSFTGSTSFSGTQSGDAQYAVSETDNIPPGWYSYSGIGWKAVACTHHPVLNVLPMFEPSIGTAESRTVGWDFGPVQFFNSYRCTVTYPGVTDAYNDWVSSGGDVAYAAYIASNTVGPVLDAGGYMDVWYRKVFRSGSGSNATNFPNTVTVGTGANYTVINNAGGPLNATFKDRVHVASATAGISGVDITATEPRSNSTPYTGQQFTLNFLPDVVELSGWGSCRVPTYKLKVVPGLAYPPYTGFPEAWSVQSMLDFKCYGTAVAPNHRMIYAL